MEKAADGEPEEDPAVALAEARKTLLLQIADEFKLDKTEVSSQQGGRQPAGW